MDLPAARSDVEAAPAGLSPTSDSFELVLQSVRMTVRRWGRAQGAEMLHFPPIIGIEDLYRAGYVASFPNLVGAVHCLDGAAAADPRFQTPGFGLAQWISACRCTEFAMAPAACYPIYPIAASGGPLPEAGKLFGAFSYCFRREPSLQASRLQSFRMQELVFLGEASRVLDFRQRAMRFANALARDCDLEPALEVAHDPFFGRTARLLAERQVSNEEKYELVFNLGAGQEQVACMSFNYHADRFGKGFAIQGPDGSPAHSTCFAVGLERFTLALLSRHGEDLENWPDRVNAILGIDP